jgi:PKD repeat protein
LGTTTHIYDTPGLYTVKLTVYSKNGKKSDEISKVISIIQPVLTEMMVPANGNNTYTTCMGILYDHGGPNGNYSNSCNGYTILYPATPQKKIRVNGTLNVESSWDDLYIIDGSSTNNTILWTGTGNMTIPDITSTASNGALLIMFTSDDSVTGQGFAINVSCVD